MTFAFHAQAAAALLCLLGAAAASEPASQLVYHPDPGENMPADILDSYNAYLSELSPQRGLVELKSAHATLDVPNGFYFLPKNDARSVIEDVWGNPPDADILGMLFPAGMTPLDMSAWGVAIYYNNDGYVSDEDADAIDYDDMMRDMIADQDANNEWRVKNNYEPIQMIGWAETPSYNAGTHKLYWAKEMKFGEQDENTLNYDIRVLGRRGALVMSFIASMDQLADVKNAAPMVLDMTNFDAGSTYADYKPGSDKKAAYGIAGLIGGAAIAKKTGLLAAILLFGKKFIVLILAGIAAAFGAVKRMLAGER